MTDTEQLLIASIERVRQLRLILALQAEIALLRTKLAARDQFDVSADSTPMFHKRQAG